MRLLIAFYVFIDLNANIVLIVLASATLFLTFSTFVMVKLAFTLFKRAMQGATITYQSTPYSRSGLQRSNNEPPPWGG